jgi:hypothetical protein
MTTSEHRTWYDEDTAYCDCGWRQRCRGHLERDAHGTIWITARSDAQSAASDHWWQVTTGHATAPTTTTNPTD